MFTLYDNGQLEKEISWEILFHKTDCVTLSYFLYILCLEDKIRPTKAQNDINDLTKRHVILSSGFSQISFTRTTLFFVERLKSNV